MSKVKRYCIFGISLIFFASGISLTVKSGLGNDPMGVFVQGLTHILPFTYGICNMCAGVCEATIGLIFERKNVRVVTFLVIFCGSSLIDVANSLIPDTDVLIVRIIYLVLGTISYCFCYSIQQTVRIGLSHYDCCIFGLAKLFKTDNYPKVRRFCDLFFIVVGFVLGGTIGIGTIIYVLFSGKIIVFFKERLINKNSNK